MDRPLDKPLTREEWHRMTRDEKHEYARRIIEKYPDMTRDEFASSIGLLSTGSIRDYFSKANGYRPKGGGKKDRSSYGEMLALSAKPQKVGYTVMCTKSNMDEALSEVPDGARLKITVEVIG